MSVITLEDGIKLAGSVAIAWLSRKEAMDTTRPASSTYLGNLVTARSRVILSGVDSIEFVLWQLRQFEVRGALTIIAPLEIER